MDIAVEMLVLLFAVAMLAGFIDAVAGGGGLLTIPALIFAGVPPVQTLGTNKLQGSFASFSAAFHFLRSGMLDIRRMPLMITTVFFSAALGSWAVQRVDNQFLMTLMPIGLIAIALYSFFSKGLGKTETAAKLTDRQFSVTAAPAIGFYDGFFGPGTGTFLAISFVKLKGMAFVRATAHAKVLNFTSNITALTVFVVGGKVLWLVGIVMAIGAFLGGRIGAGMVINKGASFVRIITVVVCVAMSVSLIYKQL
ncbi:hypothetical protein EDC56_1997 [Sinobacterium caligoides]|uniref:Probable membrane transporter protein n=1 Tax=Sinobacterium caligoides TaxID=933926 RepID=A0A3N2DQI0_9GAMM|nr:TSUP family transporter [Sinobacterium caligoides]ROS01555.1 hypothetical protein EDC56_1997 [Sinobacterium caligoides]